MLRQWWLYAPQYHFIMAGGLAIALGLLFNINRKIRR